LYSNQNGTLKIEFKKQRKKDPLSLYRVIGAVKNQNLIKNEKTFFSNFSEKEKLNTVKILDSLASYKFKLSKTPNKTKLVSKIFNSSFNFFLSK